MCFKFLCVPWSGPYLRALMRLACPIVRKVVCVGSCWRFFLALLLSLALCVLFMRGSKIKIWPPFGNAYAHFSPLSVGLLIVTKGHWVYF